ncbi:ROK family transcriptional regulator [Chelativorans xinjiangense]|uniref:ROK family transcriptional regulator n=1 Tax=Chelativorans xinjiangense TaxID=2681485 RepID=UPI00135B0AB6|nr:ROK family transcriptional regulator [Chelativorans xinjiangense]
MSYDPEALIARHFLRETENAVVSANERAILRLIWHKPGISRSEITAHVELTQQSVYRIIDQLTERGMLLLGAPKPGRGQPSPTLRPNGAFAYSTGISVNTDIVGICLVDMAGRLLAQSTMSLAGETMAQSLERIEEHVAEHRARCGLTEEGWLGVGFAIAGYHVGGTRYNAPLPLHEWSLIELGPLFAERFGKPVWVHNGADTGAIAEAMFGAGRYVRHLAYLSFNYGFGGGLIHDGELLLGGNGNAGEFSGIYDEEEGKRRPALQYLIERLRENGVDVPSISYMRQHFDPDWPGVADWVEEVTPAYNRLINAIYAVFDPQAIVFGGQVPPDLAHMLIARTRIYGRPRYGVSRPSPKLVVSDIKGDASALGAAVAPFKAMLY